MTPKDVEDGQRFTIHNQNEVWHMETRDVDERSIWYIEPGQTHRDMYDENGRTMWGAHWNMEIELVKE